MAQEYEQTQAVSAPADHEFAWLSDVGHLPHYLPEVKDARVEGEASPGKPGQRIRMRVEIPGRWQADGEGYLSVDRDARRMEWGSEMGRDYSGSLTVEGTGQAESTVSVQLSFGARSVEGEVQHESSDDRNPIEESLGRTLESIRRRIEEGSGKLEPTGP